MPLKIKIFSHSNIFELQRDVNEWLDNKEKKGIISVNTTHGDQGMFVVTVFYDTYSYLSDK